MMRLIKRVGIALATIVGALAVIVGLGTVIPQPFAGSGDDSPATRRILVISSLLHTDIALPLDAETLHSFGFLADTGLPLSHPDARWLLMGWGGRAFYLETPGLGDIKPGPTFRALTVDRSVMHVDVWGEIIGNDGGVVALDISETAYRRLVAGIAGSFTRQDGHIMPIEGFAFGSTDRFFEAEGWFNALLGCNVWTARMLRSAGVRTGLWTPLPVLLNTSLRLFNKTDALPAL